MGITALFSCAVQGDVRIPSSTAPSYTAVHAASYDDAEVAGLRRRRHSLPPERPDDISSSVTSTPGALLWSSLSVAHMYTRGPSSSR